MQEHWNLHKFVETILQTVHGACVHKPYAIPDDMGQQTALLVVLTSK